MNTIGSHYKHNKTKLETKLPKKSNNPFFPFQFLTKFTNCNLALQPVSSFNAIRFGRSANTKMKKNAVEEWTNRRQLNIICLHEAKPSLNKTQTLKLL